MRFAIVSMTLALLALPVPAAAVVLVKGDIIIATNGGSLFSIDPATGDSTLISQWDNICCVGTGPGIAQSIQLAIDPDGTILLAGNLMAPEVGQGVLRVDPSTGNRTLVSGSGQGTGWTGGADSLAVVPGPDFLQMSLLPAWGLAVFVGFLVGISAKAVRARRRAGPSPSSEEI